jgi:hypothetical protein
MRTRTVSIPAPRFPKTPQLNLIQFAGSRRDLLHIQHRQGLRTGSAFWLLGSADRTCGAFQVASLCREISVRCPEASAWGTRRTQKSYRRPGSQGRGSLLRVAISPNGSAPPYWLQGVSRHRCAARSRFSDGAGDRSQFGFVCHRSRPVCGHIRPAPAHQGSANAYTKMPAFDIRLFWHERYHHDPSHRWFLQVFVKLFQERRGTPRGQER